MDSNQAQEITQEVFNQLKLSETIADVNNIPEKMISQHKILLNRNFMDRNQYPEIKFALTASEIEKLKDRDIIVEHHNLNNEVSNILTDPLTKLLYAIVWKNGDLKKVKHIVNGILNAERSDNLEENSALVFRQFGRYLTKDEREPIIDQHVMRAFLIYKSKNDEEIKVWQKLSSFSPTNKKQLDCFSKAVEEYKAFLISSELTDKLKSCVSYKFEIDNLLFALGKSIKINVKKKSA